MKKPHTNLQDFNSHAHVERDQFWLANFYNSIDFNSHAHVERDKQAVYMQMSHDISTHTLTWSVTRATNGSKTVNRISTHTLTWSVTDGAISAGLTGVISTHTLTWSVTNMTDLEKSMVEFQLTRSRGA